MATPAGEGRAHHLQALPVLKRQLITPQVEKCYLQDTHEQFANVGVPEAPASHRCLTCFCERQ